MPGFMSPVPRALILFLTYEGLRRFATCPSLFYFAPLFAGLRSYARLWLAITSTIYHFSRNPIRKSTYPKSLRYYEAYPIR